MNPISDVIKGGVEGLFGKVTDFIDKMTLSKEEKVAAKEQWQQLLQQHELDLQSAAIRQEQVYMQDRDSARQREVELAKAKAGKTDWLMYITGGVGLGAFVFILVILAFRHIPAENKEFFINIIGIIEGAVISMFSYYFGSSRGSKEKTQLLSQQQSLPSQQATPADMDELLKSRRERRREEKT